MPQLEQHVCDSLEEAAIAIFFPLVGGLFLTATEIWNGPVSYIQKGEPQFGVGRLQHRSSTIVFSAFKEMVAGVGLLAASLAVGIIALAVGPGILGRWMTAAVPPCSLRLFVRPASEASSERKIRRRRRPDDIVDETVTMLGTSQR
ncbi:hypothetical protein ISCGN_002480 [Ixodes scapularis]